PSGGSVGIGFAVPSNLARHVVYQLREYGETRRGWLGVRIQTVTDDLAESLGLDRSRGALVASISADSPAAAAGIEVGDVIVAFDGKSVETMRRLPRIVAETQIDKQVTVEVWRDGAVVALPVTVGRLDETGTQVASAALPGPEAPVLSEVPALGLTLSALTDELRTEFQIQEDVNGVMVVAVDVSGVAAEKGVQPGDIIVEVGQEEVSTPADVETKVEEHRQHDKRTVLLLLDRQGDLQFIALRLLDS
ncbi:MAG: PDZ domain-containing protein, partial [Alphaproteobacteria bacterium]|nr:PDZ domain-containing protein [Alphaproteobacteria bacterium]